MTENKYLALIQQKLGGAISTADDAILTQWLNANEVNQATFEDYKAIWKLTEILSDDYEVDVDKGFDKLNKRIQSEKATTQTPKSNVVPMRRRILQIAAAVAVLLGAGFVFNLVTTNNVDNNWVTVTTNNTEKQSVTLSDGTIVSVNQNSVFKYPENFTDKTRSVQLVGEAFFEVTKNEKQPFIIDTDKTQVTVLGTSFNVREYAKELLTEVIVRSGKVKFSPKNNIEAVQLTAFKKGVYFHTDRSLKESKLNHLNDIAWHSGIVKFDGAPLSEVIRILNRQLGYSIDMENKELLSCNYTGNFSGLSADQIANAISISFGATNPIFNTTKQQYVITGGACVNQ